MIENMIEENTKQLNDDWKPNDNKGIRIITKNDNTGDETEPKQQEGGLVMIDKMIEQLKFIEEGVGYSEKGKRNPIRDDTQNLLTMATVMWRPKRILELGTAFGLSGLCLLRGAPLAELITMEFGEDAAKEAQDNFNDAGVNAKVIVGDAGDSIKDLTGHFDIVFIDHEKKSYLPHFKALQELGVIGDGKTLILADNVNDRREECADFVRHMEIMFPRTYIVQTECGLLVARV